MMAQATKSVPSASFHANADAISSEDRVRVAEFVNRVAGIQLPETKKALIETRLRKRQRTLGFESLKHYIDDVLGNEDSPELVHFLDALTTNKTDFYREEEHFKFLYDYLHQHSHLLNGPFLVWSAGCSSGQEAYTLAIELREQSMAYQSFNPSILATDLSISSLAKARKAIYSENCVDMMPIELKRRHLLRAKKADDYRVMIAPETRELVTFDEFNLITGDYSDKRQMFNVIFCRNVMIYFSNIDRAKLSDRYADSLKPGGLLFIGHSETLFDPSGRFERLVPTIYRKKR